MTGAAFALLGVIIAMVGVAVGLLMQVSQKLERIEARLTEMDTKSP